MLKKIALAGFVLATFIAYSINQRGGGSAPIVAPAATPGKSEVVPSTTSSAGKYKDGTYTGKASDAFYGYIQVQAVITGGKLSDVTFLQYPNEQQHSVEINSQAMPLLKQQAIQAQSAHVDGVSGASDTSQAFVDSLTDALQQANA